MSILKDAVEKQDANAKHPWLINGPELTPEQGAILNKMSVYVAVPMYGGKCEGMFAASVIDLFTNFTRFGMAHARQFLYNESLIQRARNTLVALYERQKSDWLFFIDADVSFNAKNALEMLLCAHYTGAKLIGASYPLKTINWEGIRKAIPAGIPNQSLWHCAGQHFVRFKEATATIMDPLAPVAVKYLGTGFMLIHSSVFDAIRKTEYAYRYNGSAIPTLSPGETVYSYFDCKIDEINEYLSEDYLFSRRCEEAGIIPQLCPWIHLQHSGTIVFDGCLMCSAGTYVHELMGGPKKVPLK